MCPLYGGGRKVVLHEREVTAFHVGALWQRPLHQFLMIVALVCLTLSFFGLRIFYVLALALLVYAYYRMFSKDLSKRSAENQWYLKKEMKVRGWWQRKKKAIAGRKEYKIYKCPKCGQKIRVPRHKGKIAIRCRKCGEEFIRKT